MSRQDLAQTSPWSLRRKSQKKFGLAYYPWVDSIHRAVGRVDNIHQYGKVHDFFALVTEGHLELFKLGVNKMMSVSYTSFFHFGLLLMTLYFGSLGYHWIGQWTHYRKLWEFIDIL